MKNEKYRFRWADIFCITFHCSDIFCFCDCITLLSFLKDGIDYAEKNGMFFIETSAKTADNINQLFEVQLAFAY